jgi:POT family proton-dependent oligopeptide transporter
VTTRPAVSGDWFGQPKGLTILFLTEMWEKFSFFGMRALQVYYMMKALHFAQGKASMIYGAYAAGVYFTPIFGGIISDRWLGRRRAVIGGGLLMACGHFMMASQALFYPALVFIALGNGLFLPNLPSQVRYLYEADDPRRGSAYNVYYVGINLGAFLAPLVCGTLGELYGWDWGFGAAGVGMCLGLAVYVFGGRYLPSGDAEAPPEPVTADAAHAHGMSPRAVFLVLLAVGVAVVVFRSAYEQTGNTLALWTDVNVDRGLSHFTLPATWFQSLNPMFVFLLTPFFVSFWNRAAAKKRDLSPLHKMALGALGAGVCYALLAGVSYLDQRTGHKTHWLWLAGFYALFTAAELYILPVGLGLFARLAPAGYGATAVAAWFFAAFAGNLLSGYVGVLWTGMSPAAFFLIIGGISCVSAAMLWGASLFARELEGAKG